MKTSTHPNIVRIDEKKPHQQHSWEVKIVRASGTFRRSFSDSKYEGKAKALTAAIECRDEELKKLPALDSYERAIRPKKTNKSGIVGVRAGEKIARSGKNVYRYPAWIATGTPVAGGKSKTKYFVIAAIGSHKAAKEMAIAQREKWEEALKKSVEGDEGGEGSE